MRLATWQGLAPSKIIGWNDAQPAQGPTLACRYRTRRQSICLSLSIHSFLFYWCEWRASSFFAASSGCLLFFRACLWQALTEGWVSAQEGFFFRRPSPQLPEPIHQPLHRAIAIVRAGFWSFHSLCMKLVPMNRIRMNIPLRLLTKLADHMQNFFGSIH